MEWSLFNNRGIEGGAKRILGEGAKQFGSLLRVWRSKKCHPFSAKKTVHYYSSKGEQKKFLLPLRGWSEKFGSF